MNGIIEKITIYPEKGAAGTELAEARLIENLGLEGDFHATGGERQLSLLFAEDRKLLAEQEEEGKRSESGLCFSRFRENISIRFHGSDPLRPGMRLETGAALLEITGETKRCHEECSLFQAGKPCLLAGRSLFAKVLKSGIIRIGNSVRTS